MGHLWLLIWIKIHYNPNTLTMQLSNSNICQICFIKFWKLKIIKASVRIRVIIYINALIHWAMLLGNNFRKGKFIRVYLILLFILTESTSKYVGVPYHLNFDICTILYNLSNPQKLLILIWRCMYVKNNILFHLKFFREFPERYFLQVWSGIRMNSVIV